MELDDITRARMAKEVEQTRMIGEHAAATLNMAEQEAATFEVIPAELEKLGIPRYLDNGMGHFLIGMVIGAMARVWTLEESHMIIDAVSAIEPDERYDVVEGPPLTESMLANGITAGRHLRLARVAIQEMIYALEEHYENELDKGGTTHVPVTELRARTLAATRFMLNTLHPIYANAV